MPQLQRVAAVADARERRGAVRRAPGAKQRAEACLDELFRWVIAAGGAITGEHGIGLAKKRWWPQAVSPEANRLHRTIKAALDPHGILNPGKFV